MPSEPVTVKLPVSCNDMPELLVVVLTGLGWRTQTVNDRLMQIVAMQSKKGRAFNFEFFAKLTWTKDGEGTLLKLELREERNRWDTTAECNRERDAIIDSVLDSAAQLMIANQNQPKPNRYGSARWATHEDIVKVGYWDNVDDSRRLVVSPGEDDNYVTISPEDSIMHALACGPTGSGKTTSVFIPNLVERLDTSAIVTEVTAGNESPHLYAKTSGYRAGAGRQQIYYFNPDDLSSDCINPIDSVKGYSDAQNLAKLIVENTTSKNNYGDDVWPRSEMNLLAIFIAHAAALGKDLGFVRSMLRNGPDDLLSKMQQSPVEEVRGEYYGFHKTSREGFRYGVFASLMQRLGLWVNPRVVALTSRTTVDLDALTKEKFTFYLAVPVRKTHLKPVAALIFNYILQQAEDRDFQYPLYLSLDEFTNFGMIPGIVDRLGAIRHKEIGVVIGVQDAMQLEIVYGREAASVMFSQLGTRMFFRPRSIDVAEKISRMAGQQTIYERKVTSSGHIQEKESGRPLIDPSEVMAMPEEKMLVFTPKTPPMLMERFTWRDYEMAMNISPIMKPEVEVDDRLVRNCDDLKVVLPWQVEGERKRREEMNEPPLNDGDVKAEIEKELESSVPEAPLPEYIEPEVEEEPEPGVREETQKPDHDDDYMVL